MEQLVEIKKVIIKVGDHEFALSLEEARGLKRILEDMFGGERTVYVPSYPYPVPYYQPWVVTYTTSGSGNTTTDYPTTNITLT